MAPSNVFSYLRPGHIKRNTSSLASSDSGSSPVSQPPSAFHTTEYTAPIRWVNDAGLASSSPISPFPPQLPPIVRVASRLVKPTSPATVDDAPGHYFAGGHADGSKNGQDRPMLPVPPKDMEPPSPGHNFSQSVSRPRTAGAVLGFASPTLVLPPGSDHENPLDMPTPSPTRLAPLVTASSYASFSRSQTSLVGGISEKLSGSSKPVSLPTVATVKGKSRLNLRNPMSLLMRRRSSQAVDPLSDDSLVVKRSSPMLDNYDPSIRGHIVHDFNAPRLNRNLSYNNAPIDGQPSHNPGHVSPQKIDREHTPVFHEHFDDNTSYKHSHAAIRAEQLVNKDFLARTAAWFPAPGRSPPPPPPLPKDSPPLQRESFRPPLPKPAEDNSFVLPSSTLSPVQETLDAVDAPAEVTPRKSKSARTLALARSRATSVTDSSFQPAGLPAHLSSRASRFSFQIPGGSDSAQEKLLEERHKAKAAEKASKQASTSSATMEDELGEYGMDDYDFDDGLDEEIPMLGEEEEFEGLGDQTLESVKSDFGSSSSPINPMDQVRTAAGNNNSKSAGLVASGNMCQQVQIQEYESELICGEAQVKEAKGLGLINHPHQVNTASCSASLTKLTPAHAISDTLADGSSDAIDDMYFDDGLIGDQDDNDAAEFDENVFDDPSGPLFERRVKFAPVESALDVVSVPGVDRQSAAKAYGQYVSEHVEKSEPSLCHKNSITMQHALPNFSNMEAYHSALADAANHAEAAGRFARNVSTDDAQTTSDADEQTILSNSCPTLIPNDGLSLIQTNELASYGEEFDMSSRFPDDYDGNNPDDALEDDSVIAAANAEALAYDEEGFFGSEFGFYASAVGESSSAWGGFFGPSGLGRTVSGRNAVREPNLTPITEQSEYSTRNSFIGPNHHRDGQQPLPSPALAQLARMSPYEWSEDEDMTIDSLRKLRKGAFGGSVASLTGSTPNSPRTASPLGIQFSSRQAKVTSNRIKEHFENGSHDATSINIGSMLDGQESDDDALMDAVNGAYSDDDCESGREMESPTLTASDCHSLSSPIDHFVPKDTPLLPFISETKGLSHTQMSPPFSPSLMSSLAISNLSHDTFPGSPHHPQQRFPVPPAIDTSLPSPSAGISTSTTPRRSSLGLVSPVSLSSPVTPSGWKCDHSRKGSAADSVTYVREHDEIGEERWVLERRRTAESGELELIGREIVEGGRI